MKYYHGERDQEMAMRAALIKESAQTGCPIIAMSRDTFSALTRMNNMVQYRQQNFPRPISIQEVKDGGLRGKNYPGLILLDADYVLESLLKEYTELPVKAVHFMPDFAHGDIDNTFEKTPKEQRPDEDKRNHRDILEKSVNDMAKKYDKLTSDNNFGEAYQVLKNIAMAKQILDMK